MATDVCSETEMIALLQRAFPLALLMLRPLLEVATPQRVFLGMMKQHM